MSDLKSCLYRGRVTHQRLAPLRHRLAYRVFMMLIDLDEVASLDRGGVWFGYNRRALFSFYDADHGARDKSTRLRDWAGEKLAAAGIDLAGGRLRLLCFPRVLGYTFNPLAILFCHDRQGRLCAVLYEVSNTFGQQHGYLFPVSDPDAAWLEQSCAKEFYVSPFMDMKADYDFRLRPPGAEFSLLIRQKIDGQDVLVATWNGTRHAWLPSILRSCFWGYPLLTLKIIAAIHWHGLRLFLKGAKFHRKPNLPEERISIEHERNG